MSDPRAVVADTVLDEGATIDGVGFWSRHLDAPYASADLPALAAEACASVGSGVVALSMIENGQAVLAVAISPDLTARIDAGALLQAGLAVLSGTVTASARGVAHGRGPHSASAADALGAVAEALAADLSAVARGDEVETA